MIFLRKCVSLASFHGILDSVYGIIENNPVCRVDCDEDQLAQRRNFSTIRSVHKGSSSQFCIDLFLNVFQESFLYFIAAVVPFREN